MPGPRGGEEGAQCIQGSGGPAEQPPQCVWGADSRSENSCLPEQMEALGDRPPGSSPSHSPGHINIYLGKAKVDRGGPSGLSLAVKGELDRDSPMLDSQADRIWRLRWGGGEMREGSDHQLGPAPPGLSFPFKGPKLAGENQGLQSDPPLSPPQPPATPGPGRAAGGGFRKYRLILFKRPWHRQGPQSPERGGERPQVTHGGESWAGLGWGHPG